MSNPQNQKLTRRRLMKSAGILAAAAMLEGSEKASESQVNAQLPKTESEHIMAVTGISSIWFRVTDFQRARKFYETVLGLRPEFLNDETGLVSYFAKTTDPPIFLIKKHSESAKHPPRTAEGATHGGTVGFLVGNAAEIMKHVAAFGGSVSDHIQEGFDSRVFTIYDPDGNVLELTEAKKPKSGEK